MQFFKISTITFVALLAVACGKTESGSKESVGITPPVGNFQVTVYRTMQANDYCNLNFEVKNNTSFNFTDLGIDFIEWDGAGYIIEKSVFRDRAVPNGAMVTSRMRRNCSATASIEISGVSNTTQIDSEYITGYKQKEVLGLPIYSGSNIPDVAIKSSGGPIPN